MEVQAAFELIFNEIMRNEVLSTPLYIPDIKIFSDSYKYEEQLPLIYIWGQNEQKTKFVISTNGVLLDKLIVKHFPKDSHKFNMVKRDLMAFLGNIFMEQVFKSCAENNCFPDKIYKTLRIIN